MAQSDREEQPAKPRRYSLTSPPANASGQAAAHGGGPAAVVDDGYDTKVKIGEALEAAARVVGDQPVRASDAAAIRAAEARAGAFRVVPGGVAEQAQAAADANANANAGAAPPEKTNVTIADVLAWDATVMTSTEKAVMEEDAAAAATRPYGVSHNREDGECQSKRSTQPRAADECTATLADQFDRI